MKLLSFQVIVAIIAVAAASGIPAIPVVTKVVSPVISPVISSQRAVIRHVPYSGYGFGTSARFVDKVDYGYGSGIYGLGGIRTVAPRYYGAVGNVIDGIGSLGLGYNYGLNDGRVIGLGYGLGSLGYGLSGLRYV